MAIGGAADYAKQTVPYTEVVGVWKGGGAAANCSVASGDWNVGISSVNYDGATGKYTITFTDVPGYQVVGFVGTVARASGVTNALIVKMVVGTYNAATKELDIEVCDAATPSGVDLATTDKLMLSIKFAPFPRT